MNCNSSFSVFAVIPLLHFSLLFSFSIFAVYKLNPLFHFSLFGFTQNVLKVFHWILEYKHGAFSWSVIHGKSDCSTSVLWISPRLQSLNLKDLWSSNVYHLSTRLESGSIHRLYRYSCFFMGPGAIGAWCGSALSYMEMHWKKNLKFFLEETTWPNPTKFHWQDPWVGPFQLYVFLWSQVR